VVGYKSNNKMLLTPVCFTNIRMYVKIHTYVCKYLMGSFLIVHTKVFSILVKYIECRLNNIAPKYIRMH